MKHNDEMMMMRDDDKIVENVKINFEKLFLQHQERFRIEKFLSSNQFDLLNNYVLTLQTSPGDNTHKLREVDAITDECLELLMHPNVPEEQAVEYLQRLNQVVTVQTPTRGMFSMLCYVFKMWWSYYVWWCLLWELFNVLAYRMGIIAAGVIASVLATCWLSKGHGMCARSTLMLLTVSVFGPQNVLKCIVEACAYTLVSNRYVLGSLCSVIVDQTIKIVKQKVWIGGMFFTVVAWVLQVLLGQMMLGNETLLSASTQTQASHAVRAYFDEVWVQGTSLQLLAHQLIDWVCCWGSMLGCVSFVMNVLRGVYGWFTCAFEVFINVYSQGFDYFLPVLRDAPVQPLHSFLQHEYQQQLANWNAERLEHLRVIQLIRAFRWVDKIFFVVKEVLFRFNNFRKQDWICEKMLNSLLESNSENHIKCFQLFCFCFLTYRYWFFSAKVPARDDSTNHTFVRLQTKIHMLRQMSTGVTPRIVASKTAIRGMNARSV